MRLRGEVDDDLDALVAERPLGRLAVADVAVTNTMRSSTVGEVGTVSRIGQEVVHDDVVRRVAGEPVVDEVRADEPGPAGDEQSHRRKASCVDSQGSQSSRGAPRASGGDLGAPARSLRRTAYAGRGAGRPSSSVEMRRTRHSRAASAKIASAKSAHVQSPSAARCQTPARPTGVDELARGRREVADEGRASSLVVDDRDLVLLGAETEHRQEEIVARSAPIEPRRADDPRVGARGRLSVELRAAVGRERARAVGLDVRLALAAVEDVVGRVRDDRRSERGRVRRPADVHGRSALGIRLRPVHVGPGRGVKDEVGAGSSDCGRRHASHPSPRGREQ